MMEEEMIKMDEIQTDKLNQNGIEMNQTQAFVSFIEEMVFLMKVKGRHEMMVGEKMEMDDHLSV